jgi:S-adenosylmethionine synthetase
MSTVTGEACADGNPDKVADQISDAVVDAFLSADPYSRVGCETLVTSNRIILAGEVRGPPGVVDGLEEVVRETVRLIGFEQVGFHWKLSDYACHLHALSADIAMGVDAHGNKDEGAGDTATLLGYAVDDTVELMPAAQQFANNIVKRLSFARRSGETPDLEPDGRCEVTITSEADRPSFINSVTLINQHRDGLLPQDVHDIVMPYILATVPADMVNADTRWLINPTGNFVIGGPDGDCGLTGRQAPRDNYGATIASAIAFSGKDPFKIDRSGSYACRYLAKNVVAAGLARRCTIQMTYAVGVSTPMTFVVDLHDTGRVDERGLERVLSEMLGGVTPRAIREHLGLSRPIYGRTAAFGHFGREPDADGGFPWERTDLLTELRRLADLGALGSPRRRQISLRDTHRIHSDTDSIVFSTQCTNVTVELAKASLQFFTRVLRKQLPGVPIHAELHEGAEYQIDLVIRVPPSAREAAITELGNYLRVVTGEAPAENVYDDPVVAAQVRLQRSQAALMLQTRLEMLTLERDMLSQRVDDLKERLLDTRSMHERERLALERQAEASQLQVLALTSELSRYSGRTPDIILEALRIVGEVSVKPADITQLVASITDLGAGQSQAVVSSLAKLGELLIGAQSSQKLDDEKLDTVLREIKISQPTLLSRLSNMALNTGIGVLGNALWAALQRAMFGG